MDSNRLSYMSLSPTPSWGGGTTTSRAWLAWGCVSICWGGYTWAGLISWWHIRLVCPHLLWEACGHTHVEGRCKILPFIYIHLFTSICASYTSERCSEATWAGDPCWDCCLTEGGHATDKHVTPVRPPQRYNIGDNGWWSSGVGKSNMTELREDQGGGSRRVLVSSEEEGVLGLGMLLHSSICVPWYGFLWFGLCWDLYYRFCIIWSWPLNIMFWIICVMYNMLCLICVAKSA